ncbi:MAG: ribonuclease HII [Actinomycetaceae bacterium]|nr:ribonuclease HII [Actinomycetaceae bacterium]
MKYADRTIEVTEAKKHGLVAALDEVGRGAIAGPVGVGCVIVGADMPPAPQVADSKLLGQNRRSALVKEIKQWALAWGIGYASPAEIDRYGIVVALRTAGRRALKHCQMSANFILLDGKHNWLSVPDPDLLTAADHPDLDPTLPPVPSVRTIVKGDMQCSALAAASILAKVDRDEIMVKTPDPGYGWVNNKGYGSRAHLEAITRLGISPFHRRSWKIPGVKET